MITRRNKRFMPISWSDLKPGQIIKVQSEQEFPADCLILDIQGQAGQKCYVSSGPFDENTGIIQKNSFYGTQNKTGSQQNDQQIAEMISGFLKYEYNYFGFIQGAFKLNDSPAAVEFNQKNVIQRGQILKLSSQVICLVLNVGDQCMGSIFKTPQQIKESQNKKIRNIFKKQRKFDKAYKENIQYMMIICAIMFTIFTALSIYLSSLSIVTPSGLFEQQVINIKDSFNFFSQALGFFSILLSSVPISFSNIIDLLILTQTTFAEWDINILPAQIEFLFPHASLAFGKVAHMFFSRQALLRDDSQTVKVFHVGGHFFLSQEENKQDQQIPQASNILIPEFLNQSENDGPQNDNSLEYLPNELKVKNKFNNEIAELILQSPSNQNKDMLIEFFRGINLCNQASVIKENFESDNIKYISVLNDEIASLEFTKSYDCQLVQRSKKTITIMMQGQQERYEELGIVQTKAIIGHSITISAIRLQGQEAAMIYIKGSIASLKNYFINKENDFQYLNLFEQKFIISGVQAIVYAKRKLTVEETNNLIITINEGSSKNVENIQLEKLLYNLTSVQLEILGVLGVQRPIHLRNRVVVDEMILNGVKPWIISKEDEQTHLTCLNSLKLLHNCQQPLIINGSREKTVMDQIQNALKIVIERMSTDQGQKSSQDEHISASQSQEPHNTKKQSKRNVFASNKMEEKKEIMHSNNDQQINIKNNKRNVVIFTGRALKEILKDQTMQKTFLTLAYISDILIGSEITPMQKQNLIKIAKTYIGKGEYVASIIATAEDQFMANEADIVANFQNQVKSADFQAISDVTFQDFSAISYLLFKHGNQIQIRLSKASQAFIYRFCIQFLVLSTYMIESGFTGAIPYTYYYYFVFILFLTPSEILAYSIFYKDFAHDYLYRIYGHYKYNFSFNLVESEFIVVEIMSSLYDWAVIFLPLELIQYGNPITLFQGKNSSLNAYQCYQVVLMNSTFILYFINTNVKVLYSINILIFLTIVGIAMIFDDDGLVGTQQLISTPSFLFGLIFQILMLFLKNQIVIVFSQFLYKKYEDLYNWYQLVESKLDLEEYEDPNTTFSIKDYNPLYQKINSATIENTLKLINQNMMKCPKSDQLENILDKINVELDNDMRGTQQSSMSGVINKFSLKLNDLNKETEYQEVKNGRETIYVERVLVLFIFNTVIFAIFGLVLSLIFSKTNIGIYYYVALCVFSIIVYYIIPQITIYLSNLILFYSTIVIFCYTIYSSQSESLQPTGLMFVLALMASLNHSYVYITIFIILISDIMNIFFSSITQSQQSDVSSFQQIQNSFIKVFSGILWSVYVYVQEFEKKIEFVNGNRKVRNYLKLKSILNILVPSLVRDKIQSGKKNFSENEGEVTIVFIDLYQFDDIVKTYSGIELIQFLDTIYNAFDQLCDQYGLEKIETVGKTYMACGGLKASEKKIDARVLNRHHSVRVTDFAVEAQKYSKSIMKKNGKPLELKIGIHTGTVISGVVGETKPQFSLIGDTVNKTSRVCSLTLPNKVSVSKEAHRYLEIYTNNYNFSQTFVEMKGIGREPIFSIQTFKAAQKKKKGSALAKNRKPSFYGKNNQSKEKDKKEEEQKLQQQKNNAIFMNEARRNSQQYENQSQESSQNHTIQDTSRKFMDQAEIQIEDQMDGQSDKSDQIDDNTMNFFGFNDDLNIDDRIIVKNPTENQIYNLVERPKYLLQFELKDQEEQFLFTISYKEAINSALYLTLMVLLMKIIIISQTFQTSNFIPSSQFYVMFPLIIFEMLLLYKIYNPIQEQIYLWNYMLLIYSFIILSLLISFQAQNINNHITFTNIEYQIELIFSIIYMMRNILFKQYIILYASWIVVWIFTIALVQQQFQYQTIQIIIGQVLYSSLLAIGIHHREMIQRKSLNYERVLNIQIDQTNTLISKLVPYHILNVIKNEKKHVDEFDDVTLLFTDMVGFTAFSKNVSDPKEVVQLLSKLFSRFDHLCEDNRVYKVHTIGDCYVIMGYNGKIDKNKRMRAVVTDEANRVIQCGLEMIEIIQEIRDDSEQNNLKDLDMRIGIHTGKFVAGIIGSKVVRYDIFGEGVLIANKMESNGIPGRVCITEDTMKVLINIPDVYNQYVYEQHLSFKCSSIDKEINTYAISRRARDSIRSNLSSSQYNQSIQDSNSSNSNANSSFINNVGISEKENSEKYFGNKKQKKQ